MLLVNRRGVSAVISIFAVLFIVLSAGCDRREKGPYVNLENRQTLPSGKKSQHGTPLRIAVAGMITPKAGFVYYRRLLDYIGEKMGRPVQFVTRDKYEEVNLLLKKAELDVAFVCSSPYVQGHDEFGLELLVAPQVHGEAVYYAYIIVHSDSNLKQFEDLRGKTFAFTDPASHTGKIVPTYLLAQKKETPDNFFNKYVFTYNHDKSIKAVADRLVDGAAVENLVWDYLNASDPRETARTKIIFKSSPYGIDPVVVRPGLDRETKERLRQIFLSIDQDEAGREILKGMMIDRFVTINDAAYNSVREMPKRIAAMRRNNGKRK